MTAVAVSPTAAWLDALESHTEPFRARQAARHRARARRERAEAAVALEAYRPTAAAGEEERTALERRRLFLGVSAAWLTGGFGYRGWDAETWEPLEAEGPAEDKRDARMRMVLEQAEARLVTASWHDARAGGQEKRFDMLEHCGEQTRRVVCDKHGEGCGAVRDVQVGCDVGRVCVRCRAKDANRRKARFGRARVRILRQADHMGLLRHKQIGGRWSEKFLTLTVPHVFEGEFWDSCPNCRWYPEADETGARRRRVRCLPGCPRGAGFLPLPGDLVGARIHLLLRAWRLFNLSLKEHLRKCGVCRRRQAEGKRARRKCEACLAWRERRRCYRSHRDGPDFVYRAFEWTPGSDGFGHPHLHLWVFGPYLDRALLRRWWAAALVRAGVESAVTDRGVILDIRSITTNRGDFHRELYKREDALRMARLRINRGGVSVVDYAGGWSLAEVNDQGERIEAEIAARVYEALEGKRIVQTSPYLLDPIVCGVCPECDSTGTLRVYILLQGQGEAPPVARATSPPREAVA